MSSQKLNTVVQLLRQLFLRHLHGRWESLQSFPAIESEMKKLAKASLAFERHEVGDPSGMNTSRSIRRLTVEITSSNRKSLTTFKPRRDDVFISTVNLSIYVGALMFRILGWLKNVKLTHVSGAYSACRRATKQLVRVYGTFSSKDELKEHLRLVAKAKKRDPGCLANSSTSLV